MEELDLLNDRFSIEGELGFFEQDGGMIFVSVSNKYSETTISLYGAHVTEFRPYNTFDVLWMSPLSNFEKGKAIRGGIPICFPWFGPNVENPELPMHGFARIMDWEVIKTEATPTGKTKITLQLNSSEETKKYWPYDFTAEIDICVGQELKVELRITNTGKEAFKYTSAIHTYFTVSQIGNIEVEGLKGAEYYQGFGNELFTQELETIKIEQEENRRYINTTSDIILHDPIFSRKLVTKKEGSEITVVWNPWIKTIKKMDDLPNDAYESYVCIEPANYYSNFISLAPGEKHSTVGTIGLWKDSED